MAFKIKRFISPLHLEEDKDKDKPAGSKTSSRIKSDDSKTIKRLRKEYPKYDVFPTRNKTSYTLRSKKGRGSFTVTPGNKKN